MYLSKLNSNEKQVFINLAAIVAEANGIVSETETYMLDMYCAEMQFDGTIEDKTFEENIEALAGSSAEAKNIIVFELIGLCLSDDKYDTEERENIKELAGELGITEDKLAVFEKDLSDYTSLVSRMSEHVFL
ncbi:MAG: hypothetical protein K5776_08215 [Lachnospiraceae bacterium]|nr:hypothetical protein [Lachnospiraceae bacterium]